MSNLVQALQAFGLEVSEPVLDGTFQRCRCRGSKSLNGWYTGVIHDGQVFCNFGDWRSQEKEKFSDSSQSDAHDTISVWHLLADAERKERAKRQQKAALQARKILDQITPLAKTVNEGNHPYLVKKGVRGFGAVGVHDGKFVIPLFASDGSLTGLQLIDEFGGKKFLPGTSKKGACFPIHGDDSVKCLCEGYATGASIHEATGYSVLVCFDAGNLVVVAEHLFKKPGGKKVLICADNDHSKEKNTGLETAEKIQREYGFDYVYPTCIEGSDFNDLHQEQGLEAVKAAITKGRTVKLYKRKDAEQTPCWDEIKNPPGLLGEIAKYYNETAVKPQPLFAVAAGLVLGSILLGRRYHTGEFGNFSSLYFVICAKSGTGKDHLKTIVRSILKAADLEWLESGGGFTAANTVVKSLERDPLQIAFVEELGIRMKEAACNPRSMQNGVFRQLLDIWSSCHSTVRGEQYSDGSIPKVDRPALTLVGFSTPGQLFEAMTENMLEQGFVNRLLPFISQAERTATPVRPSIIEPPSSIVEACKTIWGGDPNLMRATINDITKTDETVVSFTDEAKAMLFSIEKEVVAWANEVEKIGLADMLSRCREISMRVSLIVAVLDDCQVIDAKHIEWAWKFVRMLYREYVNSIKRVSSGSLFEKSKKEALADLRHRGEEGLRVSAMPKTKPWARWDKKLRSEILSELQEAGLADLFQQRNGNRGPLAATWVAIESGG